MKHLSQLSGRARRRHRRLLAEVLRRGVVYLRHEPLFRQAERLHRAGLATAVASKWNFLGEGTRPFRELAVFASEVEARRRYPRTVMPGRGSWGIG